ncbi:hypothetical protein Ait01nite_056400 [Actinoplanes italicus]|uniref:Uncharacterized protein n=1 Tax=Actinoplanes italicus TaxID=113567 RepID=A0A2T0K5G1_9ACTN|nr:hypothetical protein [Actinoplanes italicus]PRX18190.1 hypothetical protein CLV67_11323 [Actinoplanes italicus]GIE32595.1 hypothetical protein Ait01nite_056400 [Actinoplanes italicus]
MGRTEPGPDEGQRLAGLRIGGYVDRAKHRAPEPRESGTPLPNIADYWPDAPHRLRAQWEQFVPGAPSVPTLDLDKTPTPADRRLPIVLTGVLALSVVAGAVLLARPLADSEIRRQQEQAAAPVTSVIPVEPQITVAPQPPPLLLSPTPSPSATTTPSIRSARLEFVTGVTELTVRTADLGEQPFAIGSPDGSEVQSATTFTGGVLRIEILTGASSVEVRLSQDIVWHLRLAAGVKTARLDTSSGTVSAIDLDGGAETFDIVLGGLSGVVPIRMAGGASNFRIRTEERVPARVTVGNGAGNVVVYGDERGGTAPGTVIESGDLGNGPGLRVDAVAGVGSLVITSDPGGRDGRNRGRR